MENVTRTTIAAFAIVEAVEGVSAKRKFMYQMKSGIKEVSVTYT